MEIVTGPDNSQNIEEELNRLVVEYQKTLLHMCSFWLKDASQAEDAVQEVYIKAYKALPEFRHECSEKTWLLRIAANVCRDMQKSRWSRFVNRSVDIANLPEPAYEMAEQCPKARVLVLDQGRIVQRGTHEELIAQEGIYRDFVSERTASGQWTLQ